MGKKLKLPLENGFAALCNHIKAIRATAVQSGTAVASLATATAASIEEIEGILNDKQDRDVAATEHKAILDALDALATSLVKGSAFVLMQTSDGINLCTRDGLEIAATRLFSEQGEESADAANRAVEALSGVIDAYRRDYVSTATELVGAITIS